MVQPANVLATTSNWTVVYDRDNSEANSIDAAELASSLLAMQQLCIRSNRVLNGDMATAELRVVTTERGSVEVYLELSVVLAGGAHVLPGGFVVASDYLKAILFGNRVINGIVGIFKLLRGRRYTANEINADTVNIIEGDLNINITMGEHSVLQDVGVRGNLQSVVNPLKDRNFDSITFRDENNELIKLEHDDFDWSAFDEIEDERTDTLDIPSQRLRVTAPNLENRGAKWQLNDGRVTRWYSIDDGAFLQRVIDGEERFGKGDILICDVQVMETVGGGPEIKREYRIVRVNGRGESQAQLPFDGL